MKTFNLDPNYFKPGEYHKCMCCPVLIAKVMDNGRLNPIGSKVHVLLEKEKPGLYIINMCANCAQELDFTDQTLLDAIHDNMVKLKHNLLTQTGVSQETISDQINQLNSDKPISGWFVIEHQISQRNKNIDDYKRSKRIK